MKDRKGKRSPNFFLMVKTVQEIFSLYNQERNSLNYSKWRVHSLQGHNLHLFELQLCPLYLPI